MKHFKIVGPKTQHNFDIEDDEMLVWHIYKEEEYNAHGIDAEPQKAKNEEIIDLTKYS